MIFYIIEIERWFPHFQSKGPTASSDCPRGRSTPEAPTAPPRCGKDLGMLGERLSGKMSQENSLHRYDPDQPTSWSIGLRSTPRDKLSRASAASCISKGYWPQNTANLIGNFKNGWWSVNVIHYKLDVRFLRMRAAYFLIVLLSSDSGLMGFSSKPPPHQTSVARKVLGGYNIKTTRFGQWYLISIWPLIDICTCYKTQWKQSCSLYKCNFESRLHWWPGGMSPWHCIATEAGRNKKTSWSQSGLLIHRLVLRKHRAGEGAGEGYIMLYIHGSFAFIDTILKSKRKA